MRSLLAIPLIALCAACSADVDQTNDSVTLGYDENLASEVADDAQNLAGQVADDVRDTAQEVDNRVDVDVDANNNGANASAEVNTAN